ncbi:MAG TPA: hypothetical protein VGQ09_07300 [Chitinophagaceae bacterium]|jgi:hypothetical protein|nr:hypothetical protein [Chitinophagaceae bacterium]
MRRAFNYFKKLIRKIFNIRPSFEDEDTLSTPVYQIMETSPINCRPSEHAEKRLNLLIPALSIRYAFGGINTAIDFFLQLISNDEDVRIIITEEATSDLLALPDSKNWLIVQTNQPDRQGKLIVCFGNRNNKTIPVRKGDIFVATAWWTAYVGEAILKWQQQQWRSIPAPLVYLVQDFEPGFYRWSSRYSMSLSTYYYDNLIAIINTKLLSDFFKKNDINFNHSYIFEPSLNKTLSLFLPSKDKIQKKKRILFYGRPSVERNAFEILVSGLQIWSHQYSRSRQWEVFSLGESYNVIGLDNGAEIQVKGKLSLHEYAGLMLTSAIGASLMISPHPSYPPLEMAAFDMGVITNTFSNKNLSDYHSSIYSLENLTPENFALLLTQLCSKFEKDNNCFRNNSFTGFDFIGPERKFNFIKELRNDLNLSNKTATIRAHGIK